MKPVPDVVKRGRRLVERYLGRYPDVDEIGWVFTYGAQVYPGPGASRRFRIASMTKSFTAATVIAVCLGRQGLNLDTPLSDVVPEVTRSLGDATVEHALTMTTGLPTDDAWADRLEAMSSSSFVELVSRRLIVNQAPGVNYEYSNLGYAILGLVLERTTGCTFQALLENHILAPLKLKGISLESSAASVQGRHKNLDGTLSDVEATSRGAFSPIGGLWANSTGIGHWISQLREARHRYTQGGGLTQEQHVLKRIQDPRVFHRVEAHDNSAIYEGYGCGLHYHWNAKLGEFFFHSGGYPGFGSHMRWHTETGLGIAIMGNQTYFPAEEIAKPVLEALVASTGYRPARSREKAASVSVFEDADPVAEKNLAKFRQLLVSWDEATAVTVFSSNVFQDRTETEFSDLVSDCRRLGLTVSTWLSRTEVWLTSRDGYVHLQILFNPLGEICKLTWRKPYIAEYLPGPRKDNRL